MLTPMVRGKSGRALISLCLAILTSLVVIVPATNAVADECTPTILPDGVVIPCVEDGGGSDGGDDGGDDGGGGPQTCERFGEEVPCSSEYGAWNGRCYVRNASPQPPAGDPAWEGHEPGDGMVLECTPPACAEVGGNLENCPGHSYYWSADPAAPVGPSAEELARRAVAAMNLSMGEIGSTPPAITSNPNAVGTIGLPVWLWIANPMENTTGPISETAPGVGLSVDATGTLDRVEWTMTSAGTTVGAITCHGSNAPGTPYDGRDSAEPSPTCGFGADLNNRPGTLTLTGTAYWIVEWQSSGGQSGQISFTSPPRSTEIRIGELQAIVRN